MIYNRVEIEGIKLAVRNLEYREVDVDIVLLKSISWLNEKYKENQDIIFHYKAIWHIIAFLELGFPYEMGSKIFDDILCEFKLEKNEICYENTILKLSKSNISQLLGKWNPKLHSMKINDAVEDIIKNVNEKKIGRYTYHCGKVIINDITQPLWQKTFYLYVRENNSYIYSVNEKKYYVLQGDSYDKNSNFR